MWKDFCLPVRLHMDEVVSANMVINPLLKEGRQKENSQYYVLNQILEESLHEQMIHYHYRGIRDSHVINNDLFFTPMLVTSSHRNLHSMM